MKLSIVATLYQSAPYISEFHERANAAAQKLVGDDYEIILVNDGSTDASLSALLTWAEEQKDPRITVLSYPANRGRGTE